MRLSMLAAAALAGMSSAALAQSPPPPGAPIPLSAYVDANGFLDVQALTCAQLADTYQQDADLLTAWYSGWYNGLAKKHFFHVSRAKRLEHEVILYCKQHPGIRIIDALAVIFRDERARHGIHMKPD
jgi:hypothetical protein